MHRAYPKHYFARLICIFFPRRCAQFISGHRELFLEQQLSLEQQNQPQERCMATAGRDAVYIITARGLLRSRRGVNHYR